MKGHEGFGARIIGHEAHEKAVREQVGGAHVFGSRVRGAITGEGPVAQQKRASEFGVRTTEFAHGSDATGAPADGVSVEELRKLLGENATMFDSLYELELAREDGARPDALEIFRSFERRGQSRAEVIDEINVLLGQKGVEAEAEAASVAARVQAGKEQAVREAENKELADAPRLAALVERQKNLDLVRGAQSQAPAKAGDDAPDFDSMTKAELEKVVGDTAVEGTGSNGSVLKDDLVKAAKAKFAQSEK